MKATLLFILFIPTSYAAPLQTNNNLENKNHDSSKENIESYPSIEGYQSIAASEVDTSEIATSERDPWIVFLGGGITTTWGESGYIYDTSYEPSTRLLFEGLLSPAENPDGERLVGPPLNSSGISFGFAYVYDSGFFVGSNLYYFTSASASFNFSTRQRDASPDRVVYSAIEGSKDHVIASLLLGFEVNTVRYYLSLNRNKVSWDFNFQEGYYQDLVDEFSDVIIFSGINPFNRFTDEYYFSSWGLGMTIMIDEETSATIEFQPNLERGEGQGFLRDAILVNTFQHEFQ